VPDSRDRFSAVADAYHRYRPGYPPALLDWLVTTSGVRSGARVADLGCGTGIFSRCLAGRGLRVVGVDPNRDMLAQARAAGGGPTYVAAEATRTGLADASVHLGTAAQAFHWFAIDHTLAELARILVPGGWACALWNHRASTPFNEEYEELLLRYSSDYAARPSLTDMRGDPRDDLSHLPGAVTIEVPHQDALSWEEMLGRVRSASYVAHGVSDMAGFEAELRRLYERHRVPDGTVPWIMRTLAIAWVASGPPTLG
jgi:ubiquinone/menaquinone biosynthesis C-methylase UbiE